VSRLPIRLKVTLAFTAAMALLLAGLGFVLYERFKSDLDHGVDQSLRSRAADVAALVRQADTGLREAGPNRLTAQRDSFAQILDARDGVFDATPGLERKPLLSPGKASRALRHAISVDRRAPAPGGGRARLLAVPVQAQGQPLVTVVGASLEDRDDALAALLRLLLLGAPVALVLASAAGYGAASAALRPIERMRRRAAVISEDELGASLPVGRSRDEVARLGETLNEMLARLKRAFDRERGFVADAGHELRTPLTILKGELELALRGGRSWFELRRALRATLEETDRLRQLADDLLFIARSDQGELPLRPAEIDVGELFGAVGQRFAVRSEQAGRPLRLAAPDGLSVLADRLRLEQALGNMVDNALRYGEGEVRLSARESDGAIELHVEDQGSGFPPEFVARAFERFTRADQARSRGGAGLGLSIVSAIAQAHGGRAGVSGADAWVSIPARVRPAGVPPAQYSTVP
jgi:heavy metal sensor kinase